MFTQGLLGVNVLPAHDIGHVMISHLIIIISETERTHYINNLEQLLSILYEIYKGVR